MKTKLLLLLISYSISTFGQLNTSRIQTSNKINHNQINVSDSIKVVYKYNQKHFQEPVFLCK